MFFGKIIGLSVEGYFEFLICGYLGLSAPLNTAFGETISCILGAFMVLISLLILPILQIILIFNDN